MSSRADEALAAARARGAGELDIERIDRLSGDAVLLTFRSGRGHQWMRVGGEGVQTLSLQRDDALPIAAQLNRVAASGPLEVLSYRPGRRLVLRQGTGDATRVLKAYRRRRFEGAVQRHATAALAVEGSSFRVPAITARDDDLGFFEMRDLGRKTLRLERLSPEWFGRVGRALRMFQGLAPDVELARHGPAEELGVLDRTRENALFLMGELPADWSLLRERLDRAAAELPQRTPVLTHRDLHDGQLVRTPPATGGIGVLDFDLLCLADAELDVANLAAHLELRALQELPGVTLERAGDWSRELCAGHGTAPLDPCLRFYRAATFLRLALVYQMRPPWAHLAPELVRRAGRSLAESRSSVV